MSAYQIIWITIFTLLLLFIGMKIFMKIHNRLTPATFVLFFSCACFGLIFYFFGLMTFFNHSISSRSQFYLRKVAYWGAYWSLLGFVILGLVSFVLMIIEHLTRGKSS